MRVPMGILRIAGMFLVLLLALSPGSVTSFAQSHDGDLLWLSAASDADLLSLKLSVEALGGQVVTLAPEGRLLVSMPSGKSLSASQVKGVANTEPYQAPPVEEIQSTSGKNGLGHINPSPEDEKILANKITPVGSIAPNSLSIRRSRLEGTESLPTTVDNSLSMYFPPIDSQGSIGSCSSWAAAYYYNTYTQAMDENLNAASGNKNYICSPGFHYPLYNYGVDGGSVTQYIMESFNNVGCANWTTLPYTQDYISWPSEAAWIEGMKRRTLASHSIGTWYSGSTDADMAAIKQHLANGGIAVTTTDVYGNWYDNRTLPDTAGVNNGVLFANSSHYEGAHAMTIVGYSDDRSYFNGSETKHGAFLVANSWGSTWGRTNTGGVLKGYMWVAYDFYKADNDCFGYGMYNDDRPDYRSKLYAVTGVNHANRGYVSFYGGVGTTSAPAWTSGPVIDLMGGITQPINDAKRLAVDLTGGITSISFSNVQLFTKMGVHTSATLNGTMTSAVFYHDFDGNGSFQSVTSTDPVVTVTHGTSGYATVSFAADYLMVSPVEGYSASGPEGGPVTTSPKTYTLTNSGGPTINWTAGKDATWLTLSETSGSLTAGASTTIDVSINANANSLLAGTHTGTVTFTNTGTSIPQTRGVSLVIRPAESFVWGVVHSPQVADVLFPVTLTAVDSQGATVKTYNQAVTLKALSGGERTIGTSSTTSSYPLATNFHDARTQVIYLASEVGPAGLITSLALNVSSLPGQTLNNWTIRMKHTPLSAYTTANWEDTGWTTVYQKNQTISSTGWTTFNFGTPFNYDGVQNLMVDFSFNNSSYTTDGWCRATSYPGNRSLRYKTDSAYGDPLNWSANTPTGSLVTSAPNIKIVNAAELSVDPTVSGSFSNGISNGFVGVHGTASSVFLLAMDSGGVAGSSSIFDVTAPLSVGRENWEGYR